VEKEAKAIMKRWILGLVALLAGVGLPVVPAQAQTEIEITAPAPPPVEVFIQRDRDEATRPREQEFYPEDIRSRYDPVFIVPLTTTVRTGPKTGMRIGVAGWTSPAGMRNLQVQREVAGGVLSFGLGVAWDVLIEEERLGKPVTPPKTSR
jgi:hypothetical protein